MSDDLKAKIEEIENDDPVREILEKLLERIEALEERANDPPIKQGKR